jgi:hypothetical protein
MSASDRHEISNYPYRPDEPDLLKQVDAVMGVGWRSQVISSVLRRFVAGKPMPTPDEVRRDRAENPPKRGRRRA